MTDLPAPDLAPPGTRGGAPRWEPVALRRDAVERVIDDLLAAPRPDEDLRRVLLVHPRAGTGTGLVPAIEVSVEVLAPGETADPPRRNSSAIAVQLRGTTELTADGVTRSIGPRDTYSVPPFSIQRHVAAGVEPSVRLVFGNAALLEFLGAHHVVPADGQSPLDGATDDDLTVRNDGRVEPIGDAWRIEYERLVDPPWVPMRSWLWRWTDVVGEFDRMAALDERYDGRRVCVLYDPATGRTNGTTPALFASMCMRPAGIIDRPHRHAAAAVNYFFEGSGWSTIDGRRITWDAGDIVLLASAWAVHHHASDDRPVFQLAVQDNPLHLAMGSLVWQENLREPPRLLGVEPGFTTNRHAVEP